MSRARISAFALILTWAASASGATLFDPALRFRVLPTAHFLIYFHQGEQALAGRLAAIAEETWRALLAAQRVAPPRLTYVVLVDQTDSANGWATPVPRDTVMVTAVWPPGSDFIGNTDDWLRVAFTHEFTHIVHLDRSDGWARVVRGIFGRVPVAFPNLFLPLWQIEGLATYQESTLTRGGRLHAGDFWAIVSEASRSGKLEPLSRVNGGLTDWPGGFAPYAYGLGFHRYLVERFGVDTLAALGDRTAGRVPYTAARAFRDVYGQSLGALWKEYLATVGTPGISTGTALSGNDEATRRTRHGFGVVGPRFDPHGCAGCPPTIFYSVRTPDGFPTLNQLTLDGAAPRPIASRYFGSTTAIGREILYFDQRETRRNAGVYGDLHALDRASGRVARVTSETRLLDPDLSPDGSTLACVRVAPGRRELVTVSTAGLQPPPGDGGPPKRGEGGKAGAARVTRAATSTGVAQDLSPAVTVLISEPETQFDAPRWSPDGRTIAVERHRLGGWSEIVTVNVETRALRVVASAERTRFVTPAWRRDGRSLVTAMAREDEPFNLYEFAADGSGSARALTHTTGGATWPDVSPDGQTIVYVGYTVDGFDVFTVPYPAPPGPPGPPFIGDVAPEHVQVAPPGPPGPPAPPAPTAKYSPLPTLGPTWWSPIVEGDSARWRIGATTTGFDVLGYHAYALDMSWLVTRPSGAPSFNVASPDWSTSYAYTRWRPVWWISASSATSFFGGPPTESGRPATATLRERELAAGVVVPIRHVRVTHTAVGSLVYGRDDLTLPDGQESRRRASLRAGWSTTSARRYGYSVGPENGIAAGVTAEIVSRALGSDAEGTAMTFDARGYLPGVAPHHVLAVRLAGGASEGDRAARRTFLVGGPSPNPDILSFSRGAISLLRGFGSNTFAGNRVALLNVDYRFPIARPQRGAGAWPLFVHTIHGAVFADAGHAWTERFAARDIKTSIGGELSADVVAGYSFRLTAAVGAAWGHDGRGTIANRVTTYVRIGHAF